MKKIKVIETVYTENFLCENVGGFINCLKDLTEKFKPHDLIIDNDLEYEYGESYPRMRVYYERDETDEEFAVRKKNQDDWEARRIADAKRVLGIT